MVFKLSFQNWSLHQLLLLLFPATRGESNVNTRPCKVRVWVWSGLSNKKQSLPIKSNWQRPLKIRNSLLIKSNWQRPLKKKISDSISASASALLLMIHHITRYLLKTGQDFHSAWLFHFFAKDTVPTATMKRGKDYYEFDAVQHVCVCGQVWSTLDLVKAEEL